MILNRSIAEKRSVCLSSLLVLFCFFYYKLTGYLYLSTDNYTIAMVTASAYDANNYCAHIHPFLCALVKLLSRLYSGADWYTVLTQTNIAFCSAWLIFLFLRNEKLSLSFKIALSAAVVVLLTRYSFWNANFTVQTGYFCFGGFLTLFVWRRSKKALLVGFYFLVFGILGRMESFLLFLPFAALKLLFILFQEKTLRPYRHAVFLFSVLFILMAGSKYLVDYSPANIEATKYNTARASSGDYRLKPWEDLPPQDEVSEIDYRYRTGDAWFLIDNENMGTDTLERIASLGSYRFSFHDMVLYASYLFFSNRSHCLFLLVWMLLCIFRVFFLQSRRVLLQMLLSLVGFLLICFYFLRGGRLPLRVFDCLVMACSFVLLSDLLEQPSPKNPAYADCLFLIFCAAVLCSSVLHSHIQQPQWAWRANTDNDQVVDPLFDLDGDELIFWDYYEDRFRFHYMESGKLMPHSFLSHHFSTGDWTYGQPYQKNLLQSLGVENPARALLEREHTYYGTENPNIVLKYLRHYYGENIQARLAGEILSWKYWSFYFD